MSILVTAIAAILIFSLLILTHEFGHFIAAKSFGVYVEDFSLGMGPKLLQKKGKETTYTLRPFPIGGWCKMRGEDEASDDPRAFNKKKVWQRMIIIAAGPLMNFITAFILFVVVYMMIGVASPENVVGETIEGSDAALVLEAGDEIIMVNGAAVEEWADITPAVNSTWDGGDIQLTVVRDGAEMDISIAPYFNEDTQAWQIGIMPQVAKHNIFSAIKMGCVQAVTFAVDLIQSLVQMITGQIEADLSGPVGIVSFIGETTAYGIRSLLVLAAYLSINLGIINLLPIPALDGSRLVFLTIEGIRRKPIDPKKEGIVHFIGLLFFFGLMIIITYKDIVRLISGG